MSSRNRFKNNKNKNQFGQNVKVGESTSSNSNVLTGGLNRNEKSKKLREIRESQKYRNNLKQKFGESADLRGGGGDIDKPKDTKDNKNRGTSLKGDKLTRTYRDRGGVLRYPYEALTERTDYLQIDINQYESARERSGNQDNLIGRVGTRRLSTRGRRPNGLTTKSLVNKGTILLQIPSQVQDGNSVSYGDSKMNTIVGAALQGTTNVTGTLNSETDVQVGGVSITATASGDATALAIALG